MDGGLLAEVSSLYVILPLLALLFIVVLYLRYNQLSYGELSLPAKIFVGLLLVGFFLVYINLTLISNRRTSRFPKAEWQLFWSYKEAFEWVNGKIHIKQLGLARLILLNILVYVPVGLLMPLVFKKNSYRYALLIGFFLSLFTEIVQYITHRGLCELDDLFNNMLGCLIGMVIVAIVSRIIMILLNRAIKTG